MAAKIGIVGFRWAVRVHWPQQPINEFAHYQFETEEALLEWLPGVLAGPADGVTIERQPVIGMYGKPKVAEEAPA